MIKVILWDFDGVILDSMPIRDEGFRRILQKYNNVLVEEFIKYHKYNAGLSRFHKIRYFYNKFLNREISEVKVLQYANEFSLFMKQELVNKKYLIEDTITFIKNNYTNYSFHIVSGSEEKELQFLCNKLEIDKYFVSINGSPIHKNDLVKNVLLNFNYISKECILIGDSINDYEAALKNNITFYGYNNHNLKKYNYIENFKDFLCYIKQNG